MNDFPTASDLNKALVSAGLDPARATLEDSSALSEVRRLAAAAGTTPGALFDIASKL